MSDSQPDYLQALTLKLADGIGRLPPDRVQRLAGFLLDQQQEDGGFAGREGGSDLYYTGFGLRALALTGKLTDHIAGQATGFLGRKLTGRESVVDFYSLLYSAQLLKLFADIDVFTEVDPEWRSSVFRLLSELQRDDGGFAKGIEGSASSTYHTFLVLLSFQLIEKEIPDPKRIIAFFRSQFLTDGGFREIRVSRRAGTNPTAAAIAGLRILDGLDPHHAASTADFLLEMQTDEGGFRANTRIPIADLLSTFTALATLTDLGAVHEADMVAARKYVESLQSDNGGFFGAAWDNATDVEYSFYGLGSLGLLATVS